LSSVWIFGQIIPGRAMGPPIRGGRRSRRRGALRREREHLAQVREQLVFLERLAEIELDAELLREIAVLLGGPRGDHHDGYLRELGVGLDLLRELEAVHARHLDVEKD